MGMAYGVDTVRSPLHQAWHQAWQMPLRRFLLVLQTDRASRLIDRRELEMGRRRSEGHVGLVVVVATDSVRAVRQMGGTTSLLMFSQSQSISQD